MNPDYEGQRAARPFYHGALYESGSNARVPSHGNDVRTTLEAPRRPLSPLFLRNDLDRVDGEVLYLDPDMLILGSLSGRLREHCRSSIALLLI